MPGYKAPLRDFSFLLNEVLGAPALFARTPALSAGESDLSAEGISDILAAAAKFAENVLAPINQPGDEHGATLADGVVTTPPGHKAAYAAFLAADWASMASSPEFGGQGLPDSIELAFNEMAASACQAWRLCSGLTLGAIRAITAHASDELKARYLPKLISGTWTGTMCLTEPHAGSDVGILTTRATPRPDGSYGLEGTKIFVTYGDHDFTENIVHMVLARLPGAPKGPKGISLFLVPKVLPNADGSLGQRNAVTTTSLEKKMGIKASPTCVLDFDDATGWLVGPPNSGLACMFTTMNYVRLDVGQQGLSQAERALQGALEYARERLQMRAAKGALLPDKVADPIIVHADVRRMLMTMKSLVEGGRALALFTAMQHDYKHSSDPAERARADQTLPLMVPIAKGFLTEVGIEVTQLGIQVWGGHGYMRENGMEQFARDVRITAIYEGTNGIQANDLMRRKVLGDKGAALEAFLAEVDSHAAVLADERVLGYQALTLRSLTTEWRTLTREIAERDRQNRDESGAASFDHLMYAGYVTLAYFWSRMALLAQQKLAGAPEHEAKFYRAKLQTARFYFERVLPRTRGHAENLRATSDALMDEDALAI